MKKYLNIQIFATTLKIKLLYPQFPLTIIQMSLQAD